MISGLSSQVSSTSTLANLGQKQVDQPSQQELEVKQKFQEFFAGTLYKMMLKSLRETHDKPAYFHGGQAEKMFQGQLDQQVAEDMAREQGGDFAGDFFESFRANLRIK